MIDDVCFNGMQVMLPLLLFYIHMKLSFILP